MVIISGQVPTRAIGEDAFQECDTVGITRPCVKHNFLVEATSQDLAVTIKKAFYVATSGRPGPVVVDIPKDVTVECQPTYASTTPTTVADALVQPRGDTRGHPGPDQESAAAADPWAPKRPMIYVRRRRGDRQRIGKRTRRSSFALLGYPVTNTLMGLGAYPATDQAVHRHARHAWHGTKSNMAMHHCDVLIAIGARFDDRVTGDLAKFNARNPSRKIVHIDIDPASISKNVRVDVPIVGGVNNVLSELNSSRSCSEVRTCSRSQRGDNNRRLVEADPPTGRSSRTVCKLRPQDQQADQAAVR